VLTHGWPSTIVLFSEVIGPLSDPTAHGGAASDAFDVVVPSLPGFGFSEKPVERGWNAERTARAWGLLMQRLGYARYVAQGRDWGCVRYHRNGATARAWPGRNPLKLRADYSGRHPGEPVARPEARGRRVERFQREGISLFPAASDTTADYRLRACGLGSWAGRLDLRHLQQWYGQYRQSGCGDQPRPNARRDHTLLAHEYCCVIGSVFTSSKSR
jgi:pimeloyl-ACP methyl ester carboxylesterase